MTTRLACVLAALLVANPAFAQKQSLGDRVASLERQAATQGSSSGQANVELLNKLAQMQTEVQALRNQVEQLQNENAQLAQRNREQYVDLDTRLQRMEGAAASTSPAAAAPATLPRNGVALPPRRDSPPAAPSAGDQDAYSAAFDAYRRGDYVESARAFQAYLRAYPQGSLAPNAWFWLGASYYVTKNYPIALQAFETLLSEFPNSGKVPDAMLKKGNTQIELGQGGPGRQTLNRVIDEFPDSEAARLAASRLRALTLESR